jgi:ketosteroid isomerase-like protein
MPKSFLLTRSMLISLCMVYCISPVSAQKTETATMPPPIDLQKARIIIEKNDKQFSEDFLKGDSVALASHYAKDGQFGSLKGNEILSAWGKSIRNSIKNNTRNLLFTTTTLTGDDEFLVELGIYELKDDRHNVKSKGKYVVVWKQEDGEWKLYRDIGL